MKRFLLVMIELPAGPGTSFLISVKRNAAKVI